MNKHIIIKNYQNEINQYKESMRRMRADERPWETEKYLSYRDIIIELENKIDEMKRS